MATKLAVLRDDLEQSSQALRHIERVLKEIERIRLSLHFQLTDHIFGAAAEQSSSTSSVIDVRNVHNSSNGTISLCSKHTSAEFVSRAVAKYQRLCFVTEVGIDVDVRVLYSDVKTHKADGDPIFSFSRLAHWAGALALQQDHPEPVTIACQSKSRDSGHVQAALETLRKHYPSVRASLIPAETISNLFPVESRERDIILVGEHLSSVDFGVKSPAVKGLIRTTAFLEVAEDTAGLPFRLSPVQATTLSESRTSYNNVSTAVLALCETLALSCGLQHEAHALFEAFRRTLDPLAHLGSNMLPQEFGGTASEDEVVTALNEHLAYFLEAANSIEMIKRSNGLHQTWSQVDTVRPMGVIEKILTNSAIGLNRAEVRPGQMICVGVAWVLTSELLWAGMEKTYNQMGRPRPYRNDRVWLAIDHTIDPRTKHRPKQQALIRTSEKFRDESKIVNYIPANTSIMHTDFTRERAQPGSIVVGSDSHTCSAGSMGALAIGFGAADVVMPLVTGETWFRVPEICRIDFVGKLPYGTSGKDVILHVLGLFKRNTIALQRAVEYGGPSLRELSMDARFAIANMTTEFGGMGACFEGDEITAQWISKRKLPQDRTGGIYFRADPDAQYVVRRTINLSEVATTMAIYPNPDAVVPITEKEGMKLDGCFIGACTTTEEELILGALALDAGLRQSFRPIARGKRRVTPGSLIIIERLQKLGLLDVYLEAGFEIGAPGCSYCVGINDVDVAQEGEVWLSSQNRNFHNRMGKGAIGHITSAIAVAASSFEMRVTNPNSLMQLIDEDRYKKLIKSWHVISTQPLLIQDPQPKRYANSTNSKNENTSLLQKRHATRQPSREVLTSRIQRFAKNVDTDAIIPAEFMPGVDNADLGSHCFEYFRPEFRQKAASGATIIVAEEGFGSGSSREDAVRALLGAGIQAVIAKSFAFIYERNQLNMGLFSATITDPAFYTAATEGASLTIDKNNKTITVEGCAKVFGYTHSRVEETLLDAGGVLNLYKLHGKAVFRQMVADTPSVGKVIEASGVFAKRTARSELEW